MPSEAAHPMVPPSASRHSPGGRGPSASPSIIHASLRRPAGTWPRGSGFARRDKAPTPDSSFSELRLDFPEEHKGLLFLAQCRKLDLLLMKGRETISRIKSG